jgi:hypothetical protein
MILHAKPPPTISFTRINLSTLPDHSISDSNTADKLVAEKWLVGTLAGDTPDTAGVLDVLGCAEGMLTALDFVGPRIQRNGIGGDCYRDDCDYAMKLI